MPLSLPSPCLTLPYPTAPLPPPPPPTPPCFAVTITTTCLPVAIDQPSSIYYSNDLLCVETWDGLIVIENLKEWHAGGWQPCSTWPVGWVRLKQTSPRKNMNLNLPSVLLLQLWQYYYYQFFYHNLLTLLLLWQRTDKLCVLFCILPVVLVFIIVYYLIVVGLVGVDRHYYTVWFMRVRSFTALCYAFFRCTCTRSTTFYRFV